MSRKFQRHNVDPLGGISFDQMGSRVVAGGYGAPTNSLAGYLPGCTYADFTNALMYLNTGTLASSTWTAITALANTAVVGVAAGYKVARGERVQVAASDTVATGLTTVVSAVAVPRAPTVKQLWFGASIGDQAGTPAAGSILITSYKPTAVNDCTPTAATDFTDSIKVNWVAVGT